MPQARPSHAATRFARALGIVVEHATTSSLLTLTLGLVTYASYNTWNGVSFAGAVLLTLAAMIMIFVIFEHRRPGRAVVAVAIVIAVLWAAATLLRVGAYLPDWAAISGPGRPRVPVFGGLWVLFMLVGAGVHLRSALDSRTIGPWARALVSVSAPVAYSALVAWSYASFTTAHAAWIAGHVGDEAVGAGTTFLLVQWLPPLMLVAVLLGGLVGPHRPTSTST